MPKVSDLSTATPDAANDSLVFLDASDTTNSAQGTLKRNTPDAFGLLLAANNLSDLASAATARANLGVAIGSDVQAHDDDLDAIAALSTAGLIARTGAGAAAARSITAATGLAVSNGDGVAGNPQLALDVNALTAEATVDGAADYFLMYDADVGAHRKVLGNNLPGGGASDVGDLTTDTGLATEMVRVDGAGTGLEYRTPAQVLADIGAVDVTGDTMTGALIVQQATASGVPLIAQSTDDDDTNNILEIKDSAGNVKAAIDVNGFIGANVTDPAFPFHLEKPSFLPGSSAIAGFFDPDLSSGQEVIINIGRANQVGQTAQLRYHYVGSGSSANRIKISFGGVATPTMSVERGGDVGIGSDDPDAQLHVDQPSASGAQPVLLLDQGDVSEEFIRLIGESAADASQSLVDAADVPSPGSVVGWFKIYVQDDAGTGPIADGTYFVPFYDAPT